MKKERFVRKHYTQDEIAIIVKEHTEKCLEPICREIGKALESFQERVAELESVTNTLISEMKEWKKQNKGTMQ